MRRIASDPGSFDLTIDKTVLPKDVELGAREFGTIWITTSRFDEPRDVAVYGGVITKIRRSSMRGYLQLSGSSFEWHLGTARDRGPVMIGVISLVGPPVVSVATALEWPLVPVVPAPYPPDFGRIQNSVPGMIMGANYQALQTRADYLNIIRNNHQDGGSNTNWLVNPRTRKVEFGTGGYLHPDKPVLHEASLTDPYHPSARISAPELLSDWEDFINQVILAGENISAGTPPLEITQILPWPALLPFGSSPYRYPTGDDMFMALGEDHPHASIIGLALLAYGLLDGGSASQDTFTCTVEDFNPGGPLQAGCRARIWAPEAGLFNPNAPMEFAGQNIWPVEKTVQGIEWGVQAGMGVYWQRGGAGSELIDLSDWVVPGDQGARLIVGEWANKKNVPRRSMRMTRSARYALL